MRGHILLLTVIFAVASLIPVAAQTTTAPATTGACSVGMVNGLLQMTGDCSQTVQVAGVDHVVQMPSHLLPPPATGATTTTNPQSDAQAQRDATIDSRKATKKSKRATKKDNQRAKKDRQHDRKRARKTGVSATSTPVPTSTPTPSPTPKAKEQAAKSAVQTPTPEKSKKKDRREARRAQEPRITDG